MKNPRTLDYAERWLRDGLEITRPPAFFQSMDADMTRVQKLIQDAATRGLRLTYAPVLVRAAALSLARNRDLHVVVSGRKAYAPGSIDIGLSIAGEMFLAPVLVLKDAENKKLLALAREIGARAPEARAADRKMMAMLRNWGWVIPFSSARKAALRILARFAGFGRKGSGTFQVSVLADVDQHMTPLFGTVGILCAGRVRDRVVAVNGRPQVRPTITLTCCADHRLWDGKAGERFLRGVREALEDDSLESELATI
jgi:pyruvate/2-oxoglutarate dehydrogenase complex dihydrolipoamide acyltransferase (E2) component